MNNYEFQLTKESAWCPGCGNFGIRSALKQALDELDIDQNDVVISAGIGQAGKMPQFIDVNAFAGLHGRSLPVGIGIKLANHDMKVITEGGDGDGYGEGGNHLIHAIRRNIDITQIVHNNQVYGLTKGQASPTTEAKQIQTYATEGSKNNKLYPLALALTLGAGFVARGFSGDQEQLKEIIKAAINYKGYALIDILQPCVVWNKINTFSWYKERVKPVEENYDPTDFNAAYEKAMTWGDEIPTGIIYNVEYETYEEKFKFLLDNPPLVDQKLDPRDAQALMDKLR